MGEDVRTLNNQWHDMDAVMFHAAFECLNRYVEDEDGLALFNDHKDELDEERLRIYGKVADLYDWWNVRRPERERTFDPNAHPLVRSEAGWLEDYADHEDTEMFLELVKIRAVLWT